MATIVREFESPGIEQDHAELGAHHPKLEEIKLRELVPPAMASMNHWAPVWPDQVLLGALRDGRLRVVSALLVKVIRDDHHIIVEAIEFDEFGFGNTLSQALVDVQRAIAELYLTVENEQARLGPDLRRVWQSLTQKPQR